MFTTLLESRAPRQRRAGSTFASALAHGAAIAAIVALTIPGRGDATVAPAAERPIIYVPTRHEPPARRPQIEHRPAVVHQAPVSPITHFIVPPIHVPEGLPPINVSGPTLTEDNPHIGFGPGVRSPGPVGPSLGVPPNTVVDDAQVDRSPRVLAGSPEPRYPNSLRSSGIQGQVVVRFVVDTLGRAELDGLKTMESTHVLFTDAVHTALARFRFMPGEVAGRKVRTMVQMPFTFALR